MKKAGRKKRIWLLAAALVILGVSYRLWLPGWPVTRLAELATYFKLDRKADMGLFTIEDAGYRIDSLTIFNNGTLAHHPMLRFKKVFLARSTDTGRSNLYDSAECCFGNLYLVTLPDGTTNFNNFPFTMPRDLFFNNIHIHINDSELNPANEYVITVDGYLKRNPDKTLRDIAVSIKNSQGLVLANVTINPAYVNSNSGTENILPYQINDFKLGNIIKLQDSAKILKYYPAVMSLLNNLNL